MAVGIGWTLLTRFGVKGVGVVSTLILARLLLPQDFGLVAMATSIAAALELATAFSFDVALISRRHVRDEHYNTVWTLNVLFAAFIAVGLLASAHAASRFYGEPRLNAVMYALAFSAFIRGFENVGVVNFRKELNFDREFRLRVAQKIIAFSVTIPLAFALRTYWALVAGIVVGNLALVILSYAMHPFRPRLSLAGRGDLFNFSKWMFLNNLSNFLRHRAIDFVIGRVGGAQSLGLFRVSYEISTLPTAELVAPINRAVLPGYAKMSHDLHLLRDSYLEVLAFIAMAALPAGFGLAATASLLTPALLGSAWSDAAPIVALLGMYGAMLALTTNNGSVYYALNRPQIVTWISLVNVATLVPVLLAGASLNGAFGAAVFYLAHLVFISLPMSLVVISRVLRIGASRLLRALWRPVLATAGMYAIVRQTTSLLESEQPVLSLLAAAVTGAASYLSLVLTLWLLANRPAGPERILLSKLAGPWRRLSGKPAA